MRRKIERAGRIREPRSTSSGPDTTSSSPVHLGHDPDPHDGKVVEIEGGWPGGREGGARGSGDGGARGTGRGSVRAAPSPSRLARRAAHDSRRRAQERGRCLDRAARTAPRRHGWIDARGGSGGGPGRRVSGEKWTDPSRVRVGIIFGALNEIRNCPWICAACSNFLGYSSHFF